MLQQSKTSVKNIHQDIFLKIPPWILEKPKVILELNELPKTKTHPCTYIEKCHHIVSHYPEHLHVFTDSSKDHSRTACAVCAIDLALNIISWDKHYKFIIFSDSLSVLTSLENKKLENPLIVKLLGTLDSMCSHKKKLCLIPSHIGVRGNERADPAAKSDLVFGMEITSGLRSYLKLIISKFLHKKWQQQWDMNIHNKLF